MFIRSGQAPYPLLQLGLEVITDFYKYILFSLFLPFQCAFPLSFPTFSAPTSGPLRLLKAPSPNDFIVPVFITLTYFCADSLVSIILKGVQQQLVRSHLWWWWDPAEKIRNLFQTLLLGYCQVQQRWTANLTNMEIKTSFKKKRSKLKPENSSFI